jgi:hypothetical protein
MVIVDSLFDDDYKPSTWERIKWKIKHIYEDIRYYFRKKIQTWKHGFPDEQAWEFVSWHSRIVVPRLKRLLEIKQGHPGTLTESEWNEALVSMIWSFENHDNEPHPIYSNDYDHRYERIDHEGMSTFKPLNTTGTVDWSPIENHRKKVQEGLELFAKYYLHLWD